MNHESIRFSREELARYNRHIIIPEFGMAAQQKLKAAKVLVVGSGGLGSPVLPPASARSALSILTLSTTATYSDRFCLA